MTFQDYMHIGGLIVALVGSIGGAIWLIRETFA